MRLAYQRLKWDSAAIQRILYGDKSRNRRLRTQALGVWNLANMVMRGERMRGMFPTQNMTPVTRTSLADLVGKGYVLQGVSRDWSSEEVSLFFGACRKYRRVGPDVLGGYAGVYEWIAISILKGGRTSHQVRAFAETVFNARKKRTRPHPGEGTENRDRNLQEDDGNGVNEESNEDNANEGKNDESDVEHDLV
jgi:hypothetical protein